MKPTPFSSTRHGVGWSTNQPWSGRWLQAEIAGAGLDVLQDEPPLSR